MYSKLVADVKESADQSRSVCTLRLFRGFQELKRCLVWHSPCHHQTKASLSLLRKGCELQYELQPWWPITTVNTIHCLRQETVRFMLSLSRHHMFFFLVFLLTFLSTCQKRKPWEICICCKCSLKALAIMGIHSFPALVMYVQFCVCGDHEAFTRKTSRELNM